MINNSNYSLIKLGCFDGLQSFRITQFAKKFIPYKNKDFIQNNRSLQKIIEPWNVILCSIQTLLSLYSSYILVF